MRRCKECGRAFDGGRCPACNAEVQDSATTKRGIYHASWASTMVALGGLLGILLAGYLYPPLDMNLLTRIAIILVFIPFLINALFGVRKQLARRMYTWGGIALVTSAALVFLNGALDKSPPVEAKTLVIRKSVSHGRGGPSYSLIVAPSWRPGRDDERLQVSGATFSMVQGGQPVRVVVHRGVFGLPWFSAVMPD